MDTIAVARRYFGPKANGFRVDCKEREFDGKWEMIKLIPDPTLEEVQLNELKLRKIPVPYRWVTVDVVESYVVAGIEKSINNAREEFKNERK